MITETYRLFSFKEVYKLYTAMWLSHRLMGWYILGTDSNPGCILKAQWVSVRQLHPILFLSLTTNKRCVGGCDFDTFSAILL